MKGVIIVLLFLIPVAVFSDVLDTIDNPSAFGMMMGGAIYTVYAGPQSIAYNPAGIATDDGGLFFSHVEHYLGVIRNDFLSATTNLGNLYLGGGFQTTRAIDTDYSQYRFYGSLAYRMNSLSIGGNISAFYGTDIINGFSADFGSIFKMQNFKFALTLKNALANITWVSSTVQYYPVEVVLGAGYENSSINFNAFGNITSGEYGIGLQYFITKYFSLCAGYNGTFGQTGSFSIGTVINNYLGFDLFISYTFLNATNFGQSLSPFTVSMSSDFGG
ncbi:PorV/PorQ family protein [Athalassotoga saccharophila]|uniref:hypothetical protein n=1 Tax=Athalassotoga saccharophila TaxID=1441386 RepID=UPI0013796055|nr:hypothetical protein [Athalassotoga saccharophila]BBJ28905.1 hypothetical protein ATHSA_1827 [Athalassotoga saccharophila]